VNETTLLLRQVHPNWVQGTVISSQVFTSQTFKPTAKDNGLLSVYNGDAFDASDAHDHFVNTTGFVSKGVIAVTKSECETAPIDVIEDNDPFDGHCSLDYRDMSNGQVNNIAKKLRTYAQQRGWLFVHE
jgi:hypothetical protein